MRSRVLILSFTDVATDPRVMRHIAALRAHYEIVTCGQGPEPEGVSRHVELPVRSHLPTTPRGLAYLALRANERAYRLLPAANAARESLAGVAHDLMLAFDLNTLPVALDVAAGRPVLVDLPEYSPGQFDGDWRWRLMVRPFNTHLCRTYLPKASRAATVCNGIAEQYQREFGVHCLTITNAGEYRAPQPRPVGQVIRAVHSGAAQPNRELELMIRAAADVPGLTLDVYLVASARNRSYLQSLRRLAAASGNVRVLDPVPMIEVPATLDAYDLGVFVLPPNSFNALHALPNKFFDFVQSGLGVLIGPSPEMAHLTRGHGLGLVLPDFTEAALRTALSNLQPETVAGWKAASCAAAPQLSSHSQASVLLRCVEELLAVSSG